MRRERALKVLLVLVGLFFLAGFYFLTISLWHAKWLAEQSETEPMFLSVYITLGVFLLLAARNPSANRSLIAFTACHRAMFRLRHRDLRLTRGVV